MYEFGDLFEREFNFSSYKPEIVRIKSELLRIIDDLNEEDSLFLLELLKETRRTHEEY